MGLYYAERRQPLRGMVIKVPVWPQVRRDRGPSKAIRCCVNNFAFFRWTYQINAELSGRGFLIGSCQRLLQAVTRKVA